MWFMLNTCFPFGSLKFGQVLSRWCLRDWPLIKTLDFRLRCVSLVDSISQVLSQLVAGELSASCETPLGRDPWKPVPSVFQALLMHLFSLLVLLCCNKSQWWVRYTNSFEFTKWIIEPGHGQGDPWPRPCHQLLKVSIRLTRGAVGQGVRVAGWLLLGLHQGCWEELRGWCLWKPFENTKSLSK